MSLCRVRCSTLPSQLPSSSRLLAGRHPIFVQAPRRHLITESQSTEGHACTVNGPRVLMQPSVGGCFTPCIRSAQRVAACTSSKALDKSLNYIPHTAVGRQRGSARKSAEVRLGHNFVSMTSLADPLSPYRVEEHRQSVC
jgi:hypothetical protein